MKRLTFTALALALAVPALAGTKAERKREISQLRKELRYVDLRTREDLRERGPRSAAGAVTELSDGSVYLHDDPTIVFEKLGAVRLNKLVLRGGERLLVRLVPPSDLRPRNEPAYGEQPAWDRVMETGPERGRGLSILIELDEYPSVREALGSLVYFPGESASEEELTACLARYPDQDERRSKLRCGVSE